MSEDNADNGLRGPEFVTTLAEKRHSELLANAALSRALIASIGLHAGLLLGLPNVWTRVPPLPELPPLTAWIQPAPPAPEVRPAIEERKPQPAPKRERVQRRAPPHVPAPPRQTEAPPPIAAAPTVASSPAPEPVAPAPEPSIEPAAEPPPTSAEPPAVEAPTVQAAVPPAPAPPQRPILDPGSLTQYRGALSDTARRHKLYPTRAIDRGWQGKVEVRLVIGADGRLELAQVKSSSGHDVLDRQAVEMMTKATALTPIPPALRERRFTVEMPVVFKLTNEY